MKKETSGTRGLKKRRSFSFAMNNNFVVRFIFQKWVAWKQKLVKSICAVHTLLCAFTCMTSACDWNIFLFHVVPVFASLIFLVNLSMILNGESRRNYGSKVECVNVTDVHWSGAAEVNQTCASRSFAGIIVRVATAQRHFQSASCAALLQIHCNQHTPMQFIK